MSTNVTTLLRNFPKIRKEALSGKTVIIKTRQGNLRITADKKSGQSLLGSMKGRILKLDGSIVSPTTQTEDWKASL